MIEMIVASTEGGVIGREGKLPWPHHKGDMKFFRENTMGKSLIMGRKTLESLPTTLNGRRHIVLTKTTYYQPPERFDGTEIWIFNSIYSVMSEIRRDTQNSFILIGGGEIYRSLFDIVRTVYWTIFKGEFDGDTRLDHKIMHEITTFWNHQALGVDDKSSFHRFDKPSNNFKKTG
jgi:dihydrofolate reductase